MQTSSSTLANAGPSILAFGPQPRLPDFVIIGAHKSASTWLQRALMLSKDVFMPRQEIAFFQDPDYGDGETERLSAVFAPAADNVLTGFRRPSYLCLPECPPRLSAILPHAKLIAILRNPVDRAISGLFHAFRMSLLSIRDPDEAFADILKGCHDSIVASQILEFGLYAKGLARYRDHFPESQIHIEVQKDDPPRFAENYDAVCRFLNISNDVPRETLERRENEGVYSEHFLRPIRVLNESIFDFNDARSRVYTRQGPVAFAARAAVHALKIPCKSFRPDIRKLTSEATRKALLDFYSDDIEQLEQMTGQNLTSWKTIH